MDLQCRKTRNNKKAVRGENKIDFVKRLDDGVVFTIFSYLDDVADIHRARAVSCLWRSYVRNNERDLYRSLCYRKAPGLDSVSSLLESDGLVYGLGTTMNSEFLEDKYKVYSSLLQALSISTKYPQDCLQCVLGSSSTDQYPQQSLVHILRPEHTYICHYNYWSSKGVSDSRTNESILLKLDSSFCIVTEIVVHPYQEPGRPIYPSRFVRFQMGHPRLKDDENVDLKDLPWQELDDNKYVWTYTSQKFPVIQDNSLQRYFKLPEPVICVGGILKIELLGRAQRNPHDGMYYTRINHVKVLGHPLSPAFEVTVNPTQTETCSSGDLRLIYSPNHINGVLERISQPKENGQNVVAVSQFRSLMQLFFPFNLEGMWDDVENAWQRRLQF